MTEGLDSGLAPDLKLYTKHFSKIPMAVLPLTLPYNAKVNCQHGRYLLARSVGPAVRSLRAETQYFWSSVLFLQWDSDWVPSDTCRALFKKGTCIAAPSPCCGPRPRPCLTALGSFPLRTRMGHAKSPTPGLSA